MQIKLKEQIPQDAILAKLKLWEVLGVQAGLKKRKEAQTDLLIL